MEIKRKIYRKMLEWKRTCNGSKALLIEGARRIGKSTIAEEFGKNEYKSFVTIDFNKASRKILESFDDLTNLDIFFQTIVLEYNVQLYPKQSLIIFDEIQKFPKAREAIKYLVADGRYDFMETGSLISIRENVESITLPSEERKIKMYPVDFEEFMVYMKEEILLQYIETCFEQKKPLEQKMHKRAMHLFKEYMLVGGMPQAIVAFARAGNERKTNFRVFPIEVKSSKNYTVTSLGRFKEVFGKKIAMQYVIHPKNLAVDGEIIKIPPYMFGAAFS